jgi:hypothetical protein
MYISIDWYTFVDATLSRVMRNAATWRQQGTKLRSVRWHNLAFMEAVSFCFRYKRSIRKIQSGRSTPVQVQDHLQGTESNMGWDFYVTRWRSLRSRSYQGTNRDTSDWLVEYLVKLIYLHRLLGLQEMRELLYGVLVLLDGLQPIIWCYSSGKSEESHNAV